MLNQYFSGGLFKNKLELIVTTNKNTNIIAINAIVVSVLLSYIQRGHIIQKLPFS